MMRFSDLSVAKKIGVLAGALLGGLVLVGGIALSGARTLSDDVAEVGLRQLPAVYATAMFDMYHDGLHAVAFAAANAAYAKDAKRLDEAESEGRDFLAEMRKTWADIERHATDPDLKPAIEKVRKGLEPYLASIDHSITAARTFDAAVVAEALRKHQDTYDYLEEVNADLGDVIQTRAGEIVAAAEARGRRTVLVTGLAAALVLVAGGLFAAQIGRRISRPLQDMLQALQNWDAAGSLDASSQDEVGRMAGVINDNVGRMRTTMEEMARITAMIEDSPSAVLFVDLAGTVSYVNRASRSAFAQLGSALPLRPEAVVGARFAELFPADHAVDGRLASLGADPLRIDAVYGNETAGFGAVRVSDATGRRLGTMVTWKIVTREAAERKKTQDSETDRRLMNRVLETCGAATEPTEVLDGTTRAVVEVLGFAAGAWWRPEAGGAYRRGGEVGRPLGGLEVESTQNGLVGAAAAGRSLVVRDDLAATPGNARTEAARAAGLKSGAATPLEGAEGTVGVIEFYAAAPLGLSEERKDALRNVAKVAAAACDRLTQQDAARKLAEKDRAAAADQRRRADALLAVVDAAAQGDLTREVPAEGDDAIGRMGAGLKRLIGDLRGHIGLIAQNAKQLGESAEELSRNSSSMARCAEDTTAQAAAVADAAHRVSGNVETVASSTEEMNASIKDIARNAAEAAKTAKAAVDLAAGTNEVVVKLGDSSQEIGAVVKVINSIAEQTNLLALNATIEAARAGDAGKGFAVVANEVKELAKETGKATEDIARRIEAIQTDTRGAVEAIGRISEVVTRISEIQTSIASAVEEQSAVTGEMGRGAGEAVRVLGESAKSVEAMTEASSDTARGAGEAQAASRELARIASELHRLVGKFRLVAETKSPPRGKPAHPSEWMRAGSPAEPVGREPAKVGPIAGGAS